MLYYQYSRPTIAFGLLFFLSSPTSKSFTYAKFFFFDNHGAEQKVGHTFNFP